MQIVIEKGCTAPTKAHASDAGYDLYAAYEQVIPPRGSAIIDTGVRMMIPEGFFGLVAGRSGMNFRDGIICPQGTIDSGYTGTIKVKLYNMTDKMFIAHKGDRIAQIIFLHCISPELTICDDITPTERGADGFGSSGR